jgi:hypothetical protein
MTSRRLFKFSAPGNNSTPEPSPEQKPNPEPLTSGDSNFESATGSPAHEPASFIDTIEGGPQVETERTRTKQVEYLEGGPQDDFEEHNPLVESSYFTEPQPDSPYSPLGNLFSAIQQHNQLVIHTLLWLNLLTNPRNSTSTNLKLLTETETVSKSFYKMWRYTWMLITRHTTVI